ncbi:hypothetical protein O3G_MSEX007540 [Manduca sexta]|uniref:Uncharacterized protein n=1 Tax=Manduca sexta TaxID=7130 RepID=A0A921Z7K8_MANSE|nr:hypothetical protein O3G_MSEX007540 [Manduca sexta]
MVGVMYVPVRYFGRRLHSQSLTGIIIARIHVTKTLVMEIQRSTTSGKRNPNSPTRATLIDKYTTHWRRIHTLYNLISADFPLCRIYIESNYH